MITSTHLGAPVRLLALFVVLTGIPLVALGWLGWQLIEQDRALADQRMRDRLENSASLLARELDRTLAAWEVLLLADVKTSVALPAGAVFLVLDSGGMLHDQGIRLPYYPVAPSPATLESIFAAAEGHEFREGNLAKAAAAYRRLSSTKDRRLRAEALMGLARCLRKQQQFDDALAVYDELAAMGATPVGGSPSELVGRRERVELLTIMGDDEARKREAALLASALWDGPLRIDRATFDFYSVSAPLPGPPNPAALALAEAVRESWPLVQQQAAGRAAATGEGRAFVAVWHRTPMGTAVLVGDVGALMASTDGVIQSLEIRLALEDPSGRLIWGVLPAGGERLARTFRETGLPWTMQVATGDPAGARDVSVRRRGLLAAGFGLMVLVIAAASYFVFRAVNRELGVARLQSDFVAAVSHEFRTPLTAIRHLAEILEEGGAAADRLPRYYSALGRETRRLHAMVESLLDFGRMEAGRRTYQLEDTSAAELVSQVVREFREHAPLSAERVAVHTLPGESDEPHRARPRIRADREAIALALRNLLDNALKYSAESSTVSVSVQSRGDLAGISVEDHGAGIPKQEQRDVFRKFVRGTAARALNVKGTGIGLTMADQIVKAHGGFLELFSEPGRGSRFTIWLPTVLDHA